MLDRADYLWVKFQFALVAKVEPALLQDRSPREPVRTRTLGAKAHTGAVAHSGVRSCAGMATALEMIELRWEGCGAGRTALILDQGWPADDEVNPDIAQHSGDSNLVGCQQQIPLGIRAASVEDEIQDTGSTFSKVVAIL
jgi:hypothetical protein